MNTFTVKITKHGQLYIGEEYIEKFAPKCFGFVPYLDHKRQQIILTPKHWNGRRAYGYIDICRHSKRTMLASLGEFFSISGIKHTDKSMTYYASQSKKFISINYDITLK